MRRTVQLLLAAFAVVALLACVPVGAGAAAGVGAVPTGEGGSSSRATPRPEALRPEAGIAQQRRGGRARARRRGGPVRPAWPARRNGARPRSRLARWLARQVGPVEVQRRRARRIGSVKPRPRGGSAATARAGSGALATRPLAAAAQSSAANLLLMRSFAIPRSDPQYASLINYSWTYDNALAVFAFLSYGAKAQAQQLLDQLQALQRTDGTLDFAYDVSSGAGAGRARAGAMAWVGLAAAAYRREYDSTRYDALIGGVLRYLLGLRRSDGLVKGGTDVSWVSTQHNLLTIGMLRDLVDQVGTGSKTVGGFTGATLNSAQSTMGNAVLSQFLRQSGLLSYFVQGVNDDRVPADVQALGSLYLRLRGDLRAAGVGAYLSTKGFYVAPRLTANGLGPVSGYRPYLDAGSPNAIWSEGTFESALAFRRLGIVNVSMQGAVLSLGATSDDGTVGPIGADRNVESEAWGEYHTWPASAAASWLLILSSSRQLLYAN